MENRCMSCMELYDEKFNVCPHCGFVKGTKAKEPYHMEPETILNKKYIVGKVLGCGGFGVTYIGWDAVLNIKVAIKEYLPSEFATRIPGQTQISVYDGQSREYFASGMQSFIEEAQRLAKFNSVPGIVGIYDTFYENNTAYIVMEYLEGETLASYIKNNGPMQYETALSFIVPVLNALAVVNKDGIIHRDISPDNIFILNDGTVKLLDFGSARYATAYNTKSLSVIVKRGYAPPEQYNPHGQQGPWTDNYAVAATLYKMLTGTTPNDSLTRVDNDNLAPLSGLGVAIAPQYENAIMNALNLNPSKRPQTSEEFVDMLTSGTERVKDIPKKDASAFPKWLIILCAAVLTVVLVIGGLFATGTLKIVSGRLIFNSPVADGNVRVPEVLGKSVNEANDILEEDDLSMLVVGKKEFDNEVEKNLVCEQDPDAGVEVKKNDTIDVKLSGGPKLGYVPETVYYTEDVAEKQFKNEDLKVEIKEEYSDTVGKGGVISQSDKKETVKKAGETTRLTVSKGPRETKGGTVTIPNMVGKDFETTRKELLRDGAFLLINKVEYSDEYAENVIMHQEIEPGKTVGKNENVYVTISLGKERVRVPDVTYYDKADATRKLESLGLRVEENIVSNNPIMADNLVLAQSVETGKLVEKGSTVVIDTNNLASQPVVEVTTTTTTTTTTEPSTSAPTTTTTTTTTTKTTSAAKRVVSGKVVKSSNNSPLSGVSISVVSTSNPSKTIQTVTTNSSGAYSLQLPAGSYTLKMRLSGYNDANKNVNVSGKNVTVSDVKMLAKPVAVRYNVSGTVTDAANGNKLSGVTVRVRSGSDKRSGSYLGSAVTTDSNGKYALSVYPGTYTIEVSKSSYINGYRTVTVSNSNLTNMNISISKILEGVRIVLTWGEQPRDLDSHLNYTYGGSSKHVYYGHSVEYVNGSVFANLDVDDTSSFGPETITLERPDDVEYTYSVYNFSGDPSITTSGARVVVYSGRQQIASYNVPTTGSGRTWNVFKIKGTHITPINTLTN